MRPVADELGVLLSFDDDDGIWVDGPTTPKQQIDFRNRGGDGYVPARVFARALGIEETLKFDGTTLEIG